MTPSTCTAPVTPRRGFALRCLLCGQTDQVIRLDLDDCETLTCTACDESCDLDDVRATLAEYQRLLAWIDGRPE